MPSSREIRSPLKLPPVTLLALSLLPGLSVPAAVVMLAHDRPYLGLRLAPASGTGGVTVVHARGPAAAIPPGTDIMRISGGGDTMEPEAGDLIPEVDGVIPDYASYRKFLQRQERLARIQDSGEISITDRGGRVHTLAPDRGGRPLASLPPDFWVQLFVGLSAWLVAAAVFAFRPREAGARYLLLSGAATLIFAPAAAVYTTRELAMPAAVFRWASDLNFFGGSLFAASFVALLFHYPRRIAPAWAGVGVVALYVVWFIMQQAEVFGSMTFARRILVMAGAASTFLLAGIQWSRTGRDPVARASLQWFLISWMLGTTLFAAFYLLPQMFGVDTTPVQGYAFLLFLLVYGGLAFGILRFRLFELGDWWRKIAGWTAGVAALVLLDMFFLFGLHLSTGVSLSLALLICGAVWLPFRGWMWGRLVEREARHHQNLFARALDAVLAPPGRDGPAARWRALLQDVFGPLEIGPAGGPVPAVAIRRDGLELELPAIGENPALRLGFAHGGRKLFTPRDAALATDLLEMAGHAITSRSAYEQGVSEERERIAREMHDNIGSQLLAALHSKDAERKDATIRTTLSDLRGLINNTASPALPLEETLAGLRVETAERLSSAGIRLAWTVTGGGTPAPSPAVAHVLRSIIREAVSNVIRHSGAGQVTLSVDHGTDAVLLSVEDDGDGFNPESAPAGNGLTNMRDRLATHGGSLALSNRGDGTSLEVRLPIPHDGG